LLKLRITTLLIVALLAPSALPVFVEAGTPGSVILFFGTNTEPDYVALVGLTTPVTSGAYTLEYIPAVGQPGPAPTGTAINLVSGNAKPVTFTDGVTSSVIGIDNTDGYLVFWSGGISSAALSVRTGMDATQKSALDALANSSYVYPVSAGAVLVDGHGTNYYHDASGILHFKRSFAEAPQISYSGTTVSGILLQVVTGAAVTSPPIPVGITSGAVMFDYTNRVVGGTLVSRWLARLLDSDNEAIGGYVVATVNSPELTAAEEIAQHSVYVYGDDGWHRFAYKLDEDSVYEASSESRRMSIRAATMFAGEDAIGLWGMPLADGTYDFSFVPDAGVQVDTTIDVRNGAAAPTLLPGGVYDETTTGTMYISLGGALYIAVRLAEGVGDLQAAKLTSVTSTAGRLIPANNSGFYLDPAAGQNYRYAGGVLEMRESWAVSAASSGIIRLLAYSDAGTTLLPLKSPAVVGYKLIHQQTGAVTARTVLNTTSSALIDAGHAVVAPITTGGGVAINGAKAANTLYANDSSTGTWHGLRWRVVPDAEYGGSFDSSAPVLLSFGNAAQPDSVAFVGLSTGSVPNGAYLVHWSPVSGGALSVGTEIVNGNAAPVIFKTDPPTYATDSFSHLDGEAGILYIADLSGHIVYSASVASAGLSAAQRSRLDTYAVTATPRPVTFSAISANDVIPPHNNYTNWRVDAQAGLRVLLFDDAWAAANAFTYPPAGTATAVGAKLYTGEALTTPLSFATGDGAGYLHFAGTAATGGLVTQAAINTRTDLHFAPVLTGTDIQYGYLYNRTNHYWYKWGWGFADLGSTPPVTSSAITVVSTNPASGAVVDEKTLGNHRTFGTTSGPALTITFSDAESNGQLYSLAALQGATLTATGEARNHVNTALITEANRSSLTSSGSGTISIHVPVSGPLEQGKTYQVSFPAGVVQEQLGGQSVVNAAHSWQFSTLYLPGGSGLSPSVVIEDYPSDQAVYITGINSTGTAVTVYFNETPAASTSFVSTTASGKMIKAILPSGSSKLKPGVYTVKVQTSASHVTTLSQTFSVVKRGTIFPDSEERRDDSFREGELVVDMKASKGTLELASKYRNATALKLEMDDIFGVNTVGRHITWKGREDYTLGALETFSRWGNATVYNLTWDPTATVRDINVTIGRPSPAQAAELSKKLQGKAIKSDYMEIKLENSRATSIWGSLPLKYRAGSKLRVVRYDYLMQRWYYVPVSNVNVYEDRVDFTDVLPGIFVAVE
jgi:hypothetical protein